MTAFLTSYEAGFDSGLNGPNTVNCHFSIFNTPENTKKWQRGAVDGKDVLLEELAGPENGYTDLRILSDGKIVGVLRMIFTYRTIVDLNRYGHAGGVDFNTYEEAKYFAETMNKIDDMPPPGWTALKRKCDRELGRPEHPEEKSDD